MVRCGRVKAYLAGLDADKRVFVGMVIRFLPVGIKCARRSCMRIESDSFGEWEQSMYRRTTMTSIV